MQSFYRLGLEVAHKCDTPTHIPLNVTQSYDHTELPGSLGKQVQLYVQKEKANTGFVQQHFLPHCPRPGNPDR